MCLVKTGRWDSCAQIKRLIHGFIFLMAAYCHAGEVDESASNGVFLDRIGNRAEYQWSLEEGIAQLRFQDADDNVLAEYALKDVSIEQIKMVRSAFWVKGSLNTSDKMDSSMLSTKGQSNLLLLEFDMKTGRLNRWVHSRSHHSHGVQSKDETYTLDLEIIVDLLTNTDGGTSDPAGPPSGGGG